MRPFWIRNPITLLRWRSFDRGILGRDRRWILLWVILVAGRGLRHIVRRRPEVVAIERLAPGSSVVVRALTASRGKR
jgi:hypothetical protein